MRLYIFFNRDHLFIGLAVLKRLSETCGINVLMKTQIHLGIFLAIENIIGFILRDRFAKIFANILQGRMTLNRQVAAIPGIEKVEANGEFISKQTGMFA